MLKVNRKVRAITLIFICCITACIGYAQQPDTLVRQRIDRLLSGYVSPGGPGVSLAVVKDGQLVLACGYGMADLEQQVPNTAQTIFDVGFISMQFTGFVIAGLADSGLLSLDDEVRKYVPELRDFGKPLKIRHLLMHTSGLRDQELQLSNGSDAVSNDQVLALIFRQQELGSEPGKRFVYCKANYTLLALIAERVSKVFFPVWVHRHVFVPLHMFHSFYQSDPDLVIAGKAMAYGKDTIGYRKAIFRSSVLGDRGLQSSAEDLALWLGNFNMPVAGNARILAMMNAAPTGRQRYHYGQVFTTYRGQPLIEQDGSDAGYRSYMGRFPERGLSVVVLSNLASIDARQIALQVADMYW